jgi:hypothetical protein
MITTRICRRFAALAGLAAIAASASALSIDPQISIDRALNSPTLAVRYTGVTATLVELRINGASVGTREVSGGRSLGETSFTIDLDSLKNGDNLVEICLFDRTGKLVAQDKTNISMEKASKGPVFVEAPKPGASVMGPVEINIGFGEKLGKSYVSFFVDGTFKSMTNFPPYNFVWDTEKETNGWHEIEAWAIDENNETHKSGGVRLFVNNPGGRTNRPGVSSAVVPTRNVPRNLDLLGADAGVRAIGAATSALPTKGATPQGLPPAVVERMVPISNAVRAAVSGANAVRPLAVANALATGPKSLVPTGRRVAGMALPTTVANPARLSSNAATTRVLSGAPKGSTATAPIAPIVRANATIVSTLNLVAVTRGTVLPNIGALYILLDGQPVRFDVAPRVENGLALAPFRSLIEKAGGKVEWTHATKTARAGISGHTLELKIGGTTASVDGHNLVLEKAPGITQSRTIVPLSFLHEALGMDVKFDKTSGTVVLSTVK